MGEQGAEIFLSDIVLEISYKIRKEKKRSKEKREEIKALNSLLIYVLQ